MAAVAAKTRTLHKEREGCGTRVKSIWIGFVFCVPHPCGFQGCEFAARRAFLKPRKPPCVPRHMGMIPASQHCRVKKRNIIAVRGNGERRASCSDKIIYSWRYSCWASCFLRIGEVPTTSDTDKQSRALLGFRIVALDARKTGSAAGSRTGRPPSGAWLEARVPGFAAGL
jgi:hypothetical protein